MALASLGAKTPFVTSTLSNAVTFASPGVADRFGLAAGVASTLDPFVEFSFPVFPSLLPAMTGTVVMARTNKLEIHFLSVDIDGVSLFFPPSSQLGTNMGASTIPPERAMSSRFTEFCLPPPAHVVEFCPPLTLHAGGLPNWEAAYVFPHRTGPNRHSILLEFVASFPR